MESELITYIEQIIQISNVFLILMRKKHTGLYDFILHIEKFDIVGDEVHKV